MKRLKKQRQPLKFTTSHITLFTRSHLQRQFELSLTVASTHLNDCLLAGPPFLNDMCMILLRFRTFPYGLSADIEKAFLHVGLDDNDRDFTRFLWLSDPMNPESVFNTFRFKTVLFGSTSSPFLLNATLRCHLQNYDQAVAHDIKNNIYVDNVISGCENETDTVQYYNEAQSIMQNASTIVGIK